MICFKEGLAAAALLTGIFCGKWREILSHVFVHCEVSLFWQKLFREAGVNWEIP